ncbi:MAG: transcription repressor NadR [Defluviitaleaceae bacterium]|nr:transcription repressor NadR [Defluviitaleaceae bacterium]
MEANARRKKILDMISTSETPLSASLLANKLGVSRQIIVGDIALLRAHGNEIIATARGYITPKISQYLGKIACQHMPKDTVQELYTIVDLGATILDVTVEHDVYGEITGNLNLQSRRDVDVFLEKVKTSDAKLLSELTSGVHLHTIACRDESHFKEICKDLKNAGYLFCE